MLKSASHLPIAIVRPSRTFRSRLKALVTLVLLISVLISSCLLIHSAQADTPTATVGVIPHEGYWNPLANSGLSPYASGFEENSTWLFGDECTYTQHMDEAAVYANGKEPMVFATSSASSALDPSYGPGDQYVVSLGSAVGSVGGWSYLIFDKTTGKPLDSNRYHESIPVDLSYSMSLSASGVSAVAMGSVYGAMNGGAGLFAHRMEAAGAEVDWAQSQMEASNESYPGSPAAGTLSYNYQGYGGLLRITVSASVDAMAGSVGAIGPGWPPGSSDAQAEVDCHVFIDPSSPLAGQLQIYVAKTANATANDLSQWTPLGNTSPTNPSPSPTPTPTPTPTPPVSPTITLGRTQGPPYTDVYFTVSGFPPNDPQCVVWIDSPAQSVAFGEAGVTIGDSGGGTGSFTVPPDQPGTYTVEAYDASGNVAHTSFTITKAPTPTITLHPNQGPPGTLVDFTVSGFPPLDSVWVNFQNSPLALLGGPPRLNLGFSGHGWDSFQIPQSAAKGTYTVTATDAPYGVNSATESFIVTGSFSAPTVSITPTDPPSIVAGTQNELFTALASGGSGTYTSYQWYVDGFPVAGATANPYSFWAASAGTYMVYATVTDSDMVTSFPSNAATISVLLRDSSVATVNGNSATVDQSLTTGVSVTVSGSSLPNSAQVTVASIDYGGTQPPGTSVVSVGGSFFYDVSVTSSSGPLGSDVNAVLSIRNPSFAHLPGFLIQYYNGNAWVSVPTTFTAPETLSATIPASALNGTPILAGIPSPGRSPNPLAINFGSAAFILIVVAVAVVIIVAVVIVARRLTGTWSVSKSTNQVEKQSTGYG
jgi:hypothetical protein